MTILYSIISCGMDRVSDIIVYTQLTFTHIAKVQKTLTIPNKLSTNFFILTFQIYRPNVQVLFKEKCTYFWSDGSWKEDCKFAKKTAEIEWCPHHSYGVPGTVSPSHPCCYTGGVLCVTYIRARVTYYFRSNIQIRLTHSFSLVF